MKICPLCNDSFGDELNFCDIDGARLAREGSAQDRNRWWSFVGAGLLVGAVVITAASIIFLPKARVSPASVSSEPQPVQSVPKPPIVDSSNTVAAAAAQASEPESVSGDTAAPELKKKDRSATANSNEGEKAPNPKAAALAAEDSGNPSSSPEPNRSGTDASKKSEPPAPKTSSSAGPADAVTKPAQPAPDLRRDSKSQPVSAKTADKGSTDKKKSDDKDKKKGGFLRVFKKIFGKD